MNNLSNLLKQKDYFLIGSCFIFHIFFSLFFFIIRFDYLGFYNIFSSILYLIIFFSYKPFFKISCLTVTSFEFSFYASVLCVILGRNCGCYYFPVAILCALFFIFTDTQNSKHSIILMCIPCIVAIFFITFFTIPVNFEYSMKKPWYIVHQVFCVIYSILIIISEAFITRARFNSISEENKAAMDEVEFIKTHDFLTRAPNRRFIVSKIQELPEYTIVMLNITNIKQINDSYGYDFGDDLLISFVNRINSLIPDDAYVSRCGGEEFWIVFPYNTPGINGVIESIKTALVKRPFVLRDASVHIDLIGGVANSKFGVSVNEILADASAKTEKSKTLEKNSICYE